MATEPEHALLRAALPNYDIGPELGRGGWGVVYAGSHAKLGRRVAIKSLPRNFAADPAVRGRFLEEAQFAARLSHPHVVQVHDYVDTDGVLALVMERMEPRTLWDRFVDDGVLADTACALTVAVSSALHAAHLLGRAHLDVKPENVLFDAANVPKLSDFGVARIIGIGREHQPLTEVIGTPAYMSPEQARGLQVGPASDVYSTAVMAYELLAGRLPFPGTSAPQDMLGHHVNTAPLPLTGVPEPLADAIMRALAKDPAARFATAEQFGLAIGRAATEAYGSRWLHDSGVELRVPGRLLDGIQAGTQTPAVQQPTRATPGAATQPHARLGTVLESRPSSAPAPGLSSAAPPTSTAQIPGPAATGQPPASAAGQTPAPASAPPPSPGVGPASGVSQPATALGPRPPGTGVGPPSTSPGQSPVPAAGGLPQEPSPPSGLDQPATPGGQSPAPASGTPEPAGRAPGNPAHPARDAADPRPEPPVAPASPGGHMTAPVPPNQPPPGPPAGVGASPPRNPFDEGPAGGQPQGQPPANPGPRPGYGTAMPGGFQPSAPPPRSNVGKIVAGVAAVLVLIVGVVIAVRVLGGSDDSAAPTTTSAGPATTAGPVLDREGTVVDQPLLDAFAAACVSLKLDGDKAVFCGCARDAVPAVSTKKEIEAATAAFLGISGSIPPAVQAAMKTCTTQPGASTTGTGP